MRARDWGGERKAVALHGDGRCSVKRVEGGERKREEKRN